MTNDDPEIQGGHNICIGDKALMGLSFDIHNAIVLGSQAPWRSLPDRYAAFTARLAAAREAAGLATQ